MGGPQELLSMDGVETIWVATGTTEVSPRADFVQSGCFSLSFCMSTMSFISLQFVYHGHHFFFFFQGDGQVQSFIVAKSGLLASYSWGGGEEPCRMAWLWHAFQPSPEHINRKNRTRVNAGYTANPVEQVRSEDTLVGMTTNTLSCTDGGQ